MSLKVLVVDDSPLMRKFLADMLNSHPEISVVGTAEDGEVGVRKAIELQPDVITMDVEMPRKNGLAALADIMSKHPVPVVMVSTLTTKGAKETIEALHLGAIDFVAKPSSTPIGLHKIKDELIAKVIAAKDARLKTKFGMHVRATTTTKGSDRVVLVAASTGGPRALMAFFESLPQGFPAAMLIVQHMPEGFTKNFADRLNSCGTLPCREAAPGDRVTPGLALMAPGGKHMVVGMNGELKFTDDPPMHGVRPAADLLFLSGVKVYQNRCIGVVMTGMGKDGAEGAAQIRHAGGVCFGESEESCTIYGMPKMAKLAGGIDAEYPISELAHALVAALSGRLARAS